MLLAIYIDSFLLLNARFEKNQRKFLPFFIMREMSMLFDLVFFFFGADTPLGLALTVIAIFNGCG